MIDSLAKVLIDSALDPGSFRAVRDGDAMFRGEVGSNVFQTWANLAKAAGETKYWPIIQAEADPVPPLPERDPKSILATAPLGGIREVLQPLFEERRESLSEMDPDFAEAKDMDALAEMVDASGIHSFGGDVDADEPWPPDPPADRRVTLHTLKEKRKGQPSPLLLIRVEHSSDVPAHLGFGGWNECPAPEFQVAVLREWRSAHRAVPACITGDVLECIVASPPQTQADALRLAAEQWIFCDDIVGQGTQSVRRLAMEIWKSPRWFFWWD